MKRLSRWLFNFAVAVSSAIAFTVLGLQVSHQWSLQYTPLLSYGDYQTLTSTDRGSIDVNILKNSPVSAVGPLLPFGRSKELNDWSKAHPPFARLAGPGFLFAYGPTVSTDSLHRATVSGKNVRIMMSYWWLYAATFVLPSLWLVIAIRHRRQQYRLQQHLCLHCGYDLQATPNQCPECGTIPKVTIGATT